MQAKLLLTSVTPNTYPKKDGTIVNEQLGLLADVSNPPFMQYLEGSGEILKDWEIGTTRTVHIQDMKQMFSGRFQIRKFTFAD